MNKEVGNAIIELIRKGPMGDAWTALSNEEKLAFKGNVGNLIATLPAALPSADQLVLSLVSLFLSSFDAGGNASWCKSFKILRRSINCGDDQSESQVSDEEENWRQEGYLSSSSSSTTFRCPSLRSRCSG